MLPTTPAPEIPVPDNEDVSFVSKVRRGSAALGALIKTAPDPEDASLSAQARRGSAAIISVGDNIRRASAKFADFATEDVIGGGLAAEIPSNQVAPAPAATPAPDTNASETPHAVDASSIDMVRPLNDCRCGALSLSSILGFSAVVATASIRAICDWRRVGFFNWAVLIDSLLCFSNSCI